MRSRNHISSSTLAFVAAVAVAAVGCSNAGDGAKAEEHSKVTSALTVPVPPVTQFVVLASRSINIANRSAVTGGHVGVAASPNATPGSLLAQMDVRVGVGQVVLAQAVTLQDRAQAGEIGANQITVAPTATSGPRSAFVAPPAAPVPGTITAGTTAVNVGGGQTQTLAAGRFGAVAVDGTLNLSGGLYEIQSLRIGVGARVNAQARTTLRITGGINAADRSRMTPAANLRAADLRVIVGGSIDANNTAVGWGTDGILTALIITRGNFRAADRFTGAGAIAAQDVALGTDSTLAFDSGFGCGSNASCNDNNTCTNEVCTDAACVFTTLANGTTCSDSNACTRTDTCQAGACVGTNPVVCAASDQCHDAGVCSPATGVCSNPARPNGTTCNDANACTRADSCQAGVCTGANPVVCTASDQCHDAGVCSPATGVCSNPVRPNGSACTDANACTQGDTCQAGACAPGPAMTCTASDQCHLAGTCDPTTGACSNPARPNGTTCNDTNACTQTDTCQAGACTGGNPVVCTASDQCHDAGACNPQSGVCSNPVRPDGSACSDANACTQTDACVAGSCVGASPVVCATPDQCHAPGSCDPASGVCSNPTRPDGTTCNDANACTQTDTCQAGACAGGNPVTCVASDQCHAAGTCNPQSGVCSNPARPDGTTCSDANACTRTDTCQAGACTGGSPVTCMASDQCHAAGTCDPASGACSNPTRPDGSSCSDSNLCTQGDACQAGACVAGSDTVTCTASDQCHAAGTCDPTTGACSNPTRPNGSTCSDGNACTQADTCQGGGCMAGAPVVCGGAGDQCRNPGTCDPTSGTCSSPAKPDGVACDDGDACTLGDSCRAGSCAPGPDPLIAEIPTGFPKPMSIVSASDQNLWLVSAESRPGGGDGTVLRITPTTTAIAAFPVGKQLLDIVWGPDGNLWLAERIIGPVGAVSAIGRITTTGMILPDLFGFPADRMGYGADGNVWFAGMLGTLSVVGSLTPSTSLLATLVIPSNVPRALTAGSDGNMWVVESNGGVSPARIARITSVGGLTEFPVTTPGDLNDITGGPDGNLWFTDAGRNEIGRVTPAGVIVKFPIPTPASVPDGITAGPDGNVWFTERAANKIASITRDGVVTELTCSLTPGAGPTSIVAGSDGNLWFTETAAGNVGRVRIRR